jgi:hypothetical protein
VCSRSAYTVLRCGTSITRLHSELVGAGIFLVDGERLVEMTEQGYASESLLQDLLARYPSTRG